MEVLDKRAIDQMQEDERKRYEEEILKHLPDCSDKCEFVDSELLMSKIPLKSKDEEPQGNVE
ncbi:MAG: hypothetical protein AMJ42_02130 [Deltaproteobacteria bacterium DG_8]|nr:MAG: hypothetical protein AMJ42_02130 [Deltaproteobacteria bacterium DG_8]